MSHRYKLTLSVEFDAEDDRDARMTAALARARLGFEVTCLYTLEQVPSADAARCGRCGCAATEHFEDYCAGHSESAPCGCSIPQYVESRR